MNKQRIIWRANKGGWAVVAPSLGNCKTEFVQFAHDLNVLNNVNEMLRIRKREDWLSGKL